MPENVQNEPGLLSQDFDTQLNHPPDSQPDAQPDPENHEVDGHGEDEVRQLGSDSGKSSPDPSQLMSKLLQGKEKEWAAVIEKKGPLTLLDLPVDILKEIVREITHTNDLTSLALTHSALHALAIPHIYSRFDIVWPDAHATSDNRTGVDALTYGLATLVMDQDVFGEAKTPMSRAQIHKCSHCGYLEHCQHSQATPRRTRKRTRRGNHFAQFTRKFSLGNGPADWVQEYLITKEGGKMLGTLVALAVARMRNLETFVWDMPTGVLRDVWLALASLGDRDDGPCSLERVWVRWHDNSENPPPPPTGQSTNPTLVAPAMLSSTVNPDVASSSLFQIPPYPRVEFPTFSILPPLKSLSVLDIDELPYVEEMSILIEKSRDCLRELRIGIAQHAQYDAWVRLPEDKSPAPTGASTGRSLSRPGGVLGILVGRILDLHSINSKAIGGTSVQAAAGNLPSLGTEVSVSSPTREDEMEFDEESKPEMSATLSSPHIEIPFTGGEPTQFDVESNIQNLTSALTQQQLEDQPPESKAPESQSTVAVNSSTASIDKSLFPDATPTVKLHSNQGRSSSAPDRPSSAVVSKTITVDSTRYSAKESTKLRLEVFKLERVPLSINVLSKAIDWSCLTSLTVLGCQHHEQLWKQLRRRYAPQSASRSSTSLKSTPRPSRSSTSQYSTPVSKSMLGVEYPLKIKKLQTDCVSSSLIAFIRDALAPDSLEWLFLQEGRPYKSNVTIDAIYKGAIRRHKGSLRKLLVDSEDRLENGEPGPNNHWRKWMFNREVLTYITSGRMTNLRELGMAIEYKDWHFFLQRLPNITQLRSLYIPYLAEHVHANSREFAMQILDIVALKPELEVCYLGIQSKCFEILELPVGPKNADASAAHPTGAHGGSEIDSEEDDEDTSHQTGAVSDHHDHDDTESEFSTAEQIDSDDDDLYGGNGGKITKHFRLREILFYDDKVSIFKARHGKL